MKDGHPTTPVGSGAPALSEAKNLGPDATARGEPSRPSSLGVTMALDPSGITPVHLLASSVVVALDRFNYLGIEGALCSETEIPPDFRRLLLVRCLVLVAW